MTPWAVFALVCLGALAYVFVGYPLLLRLIIHVRGPRAVAKDDITPTVSLVISAFNEADVIAAKLQNAVTLDYPRDLLQIVVISDASDDGTDAIVEGFAARGVELQRQAQRRGKTAGLNAVVPHLRGEVVVFSDANAMYQPDAIRKLVRNFADPSVGCVTGEARYEDAGNATAEAGEGVYWSYELQLKQLETAVGSSVGGDGAIYAIRRTLWQTLPEDGINDFLNPLQIVAAGWRGVYEPEAVALEEAAGETKKEYRRRVRIVSRSWRAVFQAADVLKPWRVGFFAVSVFSHKVLRWWSGLFAVGLAVGMAGVLLPRLALVSTRTLAVLAVAAAALLLVRPVRRTIRLATYFFVLTSASLVGIFRGSTGQVSGVWSPPRQDSRGATRRVVDTWSAVALATSVVALSLLGYELQLHPDTARLIFWLSLGLLGYVFVGYPLVLWAARLVYRRPVSADDTLLPTVCVLVAANDEGRVIGAKVRNTLTLDYPADRLRLVVASDGSVDDTNAIVASCDDPRVTLHAYPMRRGKIAALADAVADVRDDVLVLSDANAFLHADAIRALVRNFGDPEVGAVSGDVVLTGERAALAAAEDLYYRYERWLQGAESELGSMVGVDGALYAVRREYFVAPPPDTVLDDMAVPFAVGRQGRRVVFEPQALAHEVGSRSAWEEFARKSRIVAGAVQLLRRGRRQIPWRQPQIVFSLLSHKVLRWASPVLLAVFLTAAFALRTTAFEFTLLWYATVCTLVVGLLGCVPAWRKFTPIAVCYYFCMVHLAAAVGLLRGLFGKQGARWERFERPPHQASASLSRPHAPVDTASRGGMP